MQSLPGKDSLFFVLHAKPADLYFNLHASPASPYIVKEGVEERFANNAYDSLPKLILIMRRALTEGIPLRCKLKGTFTHVVCGFTPNKKINDTDAVFEFDDWRQAKIIYSFCKELFGELIKTEKSSSKFFNLIVESKPVPLDLTFMQTDVNIPDCTSAFDGFALNIILREQEQIDLVPTQSDWVSPYCSLRESCRLISENKDRVSVKHALATQKGLLRYVHKLTRGLFLEDKSMTTKVERAYCQAFFLQYNNIRGLMMLSENLQQHIFKHFNLEESEEFWAVDSFFSQFLSLIQNSSIPINSSETFIDQNRLSRLIEQIRGFFFQNRKKPALLTEERKFQDDEASIQSAPIDLPIVCEIDKTLDREESDRKNLELVDDNRPQTQIDPPVICEIEKQPEVIEKEIEEENLQDNDLSQPLTPTPVVSEVIKSSKPIPENDPLKHIRSLEQYVQKAETSKNVALGDRVKHFMFLLKKDKQKNEIKGLEECAHGLLLELENNSLDASTFMTLFFTAYERSLCMAFFWIRNALEKGSRRRAQNIFNSFKFSAKHSLVLEICNEIGERLNLFPQETRLLCLEWIVEQLKTVNHAILFSSFKLLLSYNKLRTKIDLITSIYPKVSQQERIDLEHILLDLLSNISYEDSFYLYQKMEESSKPYPYQVLFKVFQQTAILTFEKDKSDQSLLKLLKGLQNFEKMEAFIPTDENLEEGFEAVFENSHPDLKEGFCRLMRRPLPNRDLNTKVRKLPLPSSNHKKYHKKVKRKDSEIIIEEPINFKMIGIALMIMSTASAVYLGVNYYKTSPNPKKELWNGSMSILKGAQLTVLSSTIIVGTTYLIHGISKHIFNSPSLLPDYQNSEVQLKCLLLFIPSILLFNIFFESHVKELLFKDGEPNYRENKEEINSVFLIFIGTIIGLLLCKYGFLKLLNTIENYKGISFFNALSLGFEQTIEKKALPLGLRQWVIPESEPLPLILSKVDLLILVANALEMMANFSFMKNSLCELGTVAKISLYSSSLIQQFANFSMYRAKSTLLNSVTLILLPCMIPIGWPYWIEKLKRINAFYILKTHTFPEFLRYTKQKKQLTVFDMNYAALHLLNIAAEMNFALNRFLR